MTTALILLLACGPGSITLDDGKPDGSGDPGDDTDTGSGDDTDTGDTDDSDDTDDGDDTDDSDDTDDGPDPVRYRGAVHGTWRSGGMHDQDSASCEGELDLTVEPDGVTTGEASCEFRQYHYEVRGPLEGTVSGGRASLVWEIEYESYALFLDATGTADAASVALRIAEDFGRNGEFEATMTGKP